MQFQKWVVILFILSLTFVSVSAQLKFTRPPPRNRTRNILGSVVDLLGGTLTTLGNLLTKPFQDYQTQYNKKYSSKQEEKRRLEIFSENHKIIDEHDKTPGKSYNLSINEFSDLLPSEYSRSHGGLKFTKPDKNKKKISTTSTTTSAPTTSTTTTTTASPSTTTTTPITSSTTTTRAPETAPTTTTITTTSTTTTTTTTTTPKPMTTTTTTTTTPKPTTTTLPSVTEEGKPGNVDWRRTNCMSDVRYQGTCSASFAFATLAAIEAQLCYKTGELYTLSPQNLIDCTIPTPFENSGCEGGALEPTFDYTVNVGINIEKNYPYQGIVSRCRFKKDGSVGKIKDYMSIDEGDEETMERVLKDIGPITIGIDATHDSFRFYGGGIYYEPKCEDSIEKLNHAVLLVGYGEEENGEKYWLIRNSYGTSWGENGYAKISRNVTNHCGVATYAVYPIV